MNPASAKGATYYRMRAEELRTAAESMQHPISRKALRDLAASYDALADRVEASANHMRRIEKPTG